jgi:hypothetical protein
MKSNSYGLLELGRVKGFGTLDGPDLCDIVLLTSMSAHAVILCMSNNLTA